MLPKNERKKYHGFTLVELIVVITILAVLATIGFLALSGYSQDAKGSSWKANARTLQTAISSESVLTWNSPRYYVVHDSSAALSGVFMYVDGNPVALTGGDWNQTGTNYSAGNPDFAKLKLNPDKFRTSFSPVEPAFSAYDTKKLAVGAVDFVRKPNGKNRTEAWFQVVAIPPTGGTVSISGTFPVGISGSVAGLVRDPAGTASDPLVEGAASWTPTGCSATAVNGYAVPAMAHAGTSTVTKSVLSGTGLTIGARTGTATCVIGTSSVTENSVTCVAGYVEGPALTCVADVCGGTIADANAHSTATLQTVTQNWTRSATAGTCTWECNTGYGWDSGTSSCKASVNGTCGAAAKTYSYADSSFGSDPYCSQGTASVTPAFPAAGSSASWTCLGLWNGTVSETCAAIRPAAANCAASAQTVNGRSYSVPAFNHATTVSTNSSSAVSGGSQTYSQTFACTNGAVSTSGTETAGSVSCTAAWYVLISGACVPNSCLAIKTAYPTSANGTYSIDPDGAWANAAFAAYCDMTSGGGGWTMAYTSSSTIHLSTELLAAQSGTYGTDGYRAAGNVKTIPFGEILYVNHDSATKYAMARNDGVKKSVNTYGIPYNEDQAVTWKITSPSGSALPWYDFNLMICDGVWMQTGFMFTGVYNTTGKLCGSWEGDTSTWYFRHDGDYGPNNGAYHGVAFAQNGHGNVTNKLVSVGIR